MFVIDKSKYICDNILYNYCRKEDLSFTYIFTILYNCCLGSSEQK